MLCAATGAVRIGVHARARGTHGGRSSADREKTARSAVGVTQFFRPWLRDSRAHGVIYLFTKYSPLIHASILVPVMICISQFSQNVYIMRS
jgi:hypothetical protein